MRRETRDNVVTEDAYMRGGKRAKSSAPVTGNTIDVPIEL